ARSRDKRAYELIDWGFEKLGFSPRFQHIVQKSDPLDALMHAPQKAVYIKHTGKAKSNLVSYTKKSTRHAHKVKNVRKNTVRSLSHYKKRSVAKHAIRFKKAQ
ncbi:MAG: hypothetical protein Q8K36_05215, partial [Alphaproteobacteria bacterium]|nr:hypothetical protein [Alphaproteobacteria bacterium]